jgi:hypothetical protein
MNDPPPVKYALYSHYMAHQNEDFKAFTERNTPPESLAGVIYLQNHFRGLRELLTTPGHEGLLVLFYAPDESYMQFLQGIADKEQGTSDASLKKRYESLRFADAVAECVRGKLAKAKLEERVRFLTPLDLRVILGRVNTIFASKFKDHIIGQAPGTRYDTPQSVEAILRLRLLGNGLPLLRLDHDVIFRGDNARIGDLGLFKAVACSLRAYQSRLAQPTVSTFLFSASYNYRELLSRAEEMVESKKANRKMDVFEAWSRAFATRVYPALVADPKKIRAIATKDIPDKERDKQWDKYVITNLDDELARQFYGLTNNKAMLEVEGLKGITSVGAHPLYAVISGALLCLSEGAILDLPPFSNFRNNVMWIDDHLKYSLHRAMNHFTSDETLNLEQGLGDARLDTVTVTKARPPVSDLPGYIFGTYLPTLLWGTIMDAWITNDSLLKRRMASLQEEEEKTRWREAKSKQHNAPLPRAMLTTLSTGHFFDKAELIADLERHAVARIEKVRQLWAELKRDGCNTFASYWAEGKVKEVFGAECFKKCIEKRNYLWEGIAPGRPLDQQITHILDLTAAMSGKVSELCQDAATYVEWTLAWPNFVQIVRSIRQGDFMGDLGWSPEELNQKS